MQTLVANSVRTFLTGLIACGLITSPMIVLAVIDSGPLTGVLAFEDEDSESSDDESSDDDSSGDGNSDEPSDDLPDTLNVRCTDRSNGSRDFMISDSGELSIGTYASPALDPTHLVVVAHGYSHGVESWRPVIERMANELNVLAVFVNYRGNEVVPGEYKDEPDNTIPTYKGWPISRGSRDLEVATHLFFDACESLDTTVLYAVSMGSNIGGFLLAEMGAGRAIGTRERDGKPLFDYWMAIEGVHNMIETYTEAKASTHKSADDIEVEMGGATPAEDPLQYQAKTNLCRASDIAQSAIQRVIYIHALNDALIGYHQSRLMRNELDVTAEFFTILSAKSGPDGTVAEDHALNIVLPVINPHLVAQGLDPIDPENPLVGHAGEHEHDHLVLRWSLERLQQLVAGVLYVPDEYLIDENAPDQELLPIPGTGLGPALSLLPDSAISANCSPDPTN